MAKRMPDEPLRLKAAFKAVHLVPGFVRSILGVCCLPLRLKCDDQRCNGDG
jgi:hypothetical protein